MILAQGSGPAYCETGYNMNTYWTELPELHGNLVLFSDIWNHMDLGWNCSPLPS